MPKLLRLSGKSVVKILQQLGFEVRRITGSHHHMRYERDGVICQTSVPVHGNKALATGTLRGILRQITPCLLESDIQTYFYAD